MGTCAMLPPLMRDRQMSASMKIGTTLDIGRYGAALATTVLALSLSVCGGTSAGTGVATA